MNKKFVSIFFVGLFLIISTINVTAQNKEEVKNYEKTDLETLGTGMIFGHVATFDKETLKWTGENDVTIQIIGFGMPNKYFKFGFVNLEQKTRTETYELGEEVFTTNGIFYVHGEGKTLPQPGMYLLVFSKEGYLPNVKFISLKMGQDGYSSLDVKLLKVPSLLDQ